MDEAGLPEESMESLKVFTVLMITLKLTLLNDLPFSDLSGQVLHKYLDDAVVSFVGITNHILDAAKSNRAVTLFRPRAADVSFRLYSPL